MINKTQIYDKLMTCRLEYPGVGPEVSFLKETGWAEFHTATDEEAVAHIDGYADWKAFFQRRRPLTHWLSWRNYAPHYPMAPRLW